MYLTSTQADMAAYPAVAHQVTAGYGGRPVIVDVSLAIEPGVTVLVGPNGAGKSTLLRALATLHEPDRGRVVLFGHDTSTRRGRRAARRHLGFLPQEPDFPRDFTVAEMLRYVTWLQHMPHPVAETALDEARDTYDLGEYWDHKLSQLSGGTRQRAFLAQATLHDPGLLMLDEPTSGIDPAHRGRFRSEVARLGRDRAVVMTSHMMEDVERVADRVVVISGEGIGFDGTPAELAAIGGHGDAGGELAFERAIRLVTEGAAEMAVAR